MGVAPADEPNGAGACFPNGVLDKRLPACDPKGELPDGAAAKGEEGGAEAENGELDAAGAAPKGLRVEVPPTLLVKEGALFWLAIELENAKFPNGDEVAVEVNGDGAEADVAPEMPNPEDGTDVAGSLVSATGSAPSKGMATLYFFATLAIKASSLPCYR